MAATKIAETLRKHQDRLLCLPNVTGIGIGEKDGEQVILVFVSKKIPESELRPGEIIPRMLEGHRIHVEPQVRVGPTP